MGFPGVRSPPGTPREQPLPYGAYNRTLTALYSAITAIFGLIFGLRPSLSYIDRSGTPAATPHKTGLVKCCGQRWYMDNHKGGEVVWLDADRYIACWLRVLALQRGKELFASCSHYLKVTKCGEGGAAYADMFFKPSGAKTIEAKSRPQPWARASRSSHHGRPSPG